MDPVVLVVLVALAAAVVVVTVLVATGRLAASMGAATSSRPPLEFPQEPSSADVDGLGLGTSAWGYAPAEVDAALDERRARLAEQERVLHADAERTGAKARDTGPGEAGARGSTTRDGAGEPGRVRPDA